MRGGEERKRGRGEEEKRGRGEEGKRRRGGRGGEGGEGSGCGFITGRGEDKEIKIYI